MTKTSRQALADMLARLEYTRDTAGRDALRERLRHLIADIRRTRHENSANTSSLGGGAKIAS